MKKIQVLAILAGVLALIFGLIFVSQNNAPKESIVMKSVVVAVDTIPARTKVTADMLQVLSIPAVAVHTDAYTDMSAPVGLITSNTIYAGEQVLKAELFEQGQNKNGLAYVVSEEAGKRAITIAVSEVTGISGYILPGDRVDLIAVLSENQTATQGADGTKTTTKKSARVILQNVKVLASGRKTILAASETNVEYGTVTLELSIADCVKLALFDNMDNKDEIRFVLRNPLDKATPSIAIVQESDIFK